MDKRDITEAGIVLIAFYLLIRNVMLIATAYVIPSISMAFFGLGDGVNNFQMLIGALISIVIALMAIKIRLWILDTLYK